MTAGLFVTLMVCSLQAQTRDSILYKQVDTISLFLYADYPPDFDTSQRLPAIVFFFGGGWTGGSCDQFAPHARYLAERGLICFRADYRVYGKHGTTPFESLRDAKSAMRFVRAHADELGVDPDQLIASGGSAGGQLAAATAVIEGFNEADEDLSTSCVPNALVLFNPVFDNGPGGYGYERIGQQYKDFSPLHNLGGEMPPTIVFFGTEDPLVPVETARYFKTVMERTGSRCDLYLYEGEGHGFFNYRSFENYRSTLGRADTFLVSLGLLERDPVIEIR